MTVVAPCLLRVLHGQQVLKRLLMDHKPREKSTAGTFGSACLSHKPGFSFELVPAR